MASKRHHYVPIFYLDYFISKSVEGTPVFWVYDKAGGPARLQTPINTAVEGHLYSFETSSGAKDDSLDPERAWLRFRVPKESVRWQLSGVAPTQDEKKRIAGFLALMHSRSPRTIQGITEASQAIGIEVARFLADRPHMVREFLEQEQLSGRPNIPSVEEMVDSLRNVEQRFEIKVNRKNSLVESFKLSERVATELFKMNWCLCRAPTGTFFVASDTPVCMFAETGRNRALLGAGFGLPNAEVTFPISPTVCLLLGPCYNSRRVDSACHKSSGEGGDPEGRSNSSMGADTQDGRKILESYLAPRWRNGAQRLF